MDVTPKSNTHANTQNNDQNNDQPQHKVWDIYTRLFHWLLVAGIVFQYLSGEVWDDQMDNHALVGQGLLGLIIFRLLWGIVGPEPVRFSAFIAGLATIKRYILQRPAPIYATHNPIGALAVVAFLGLVLLQAVSGLFMTDDIFFYGPWYELDSDIASFMSSVHDIVITLILVLVAIHIIAVLVHKITTEPFIITAIFSGRKPVTHSMTVFTGLTLHLRAIACIAISALITWVAVVGMPEWLGLISEDMWDY